ncbi:DNA primase [Alteribacillus sp. HJP-4]|uniref:DNA primase n=1 Tax=Alteribacillus sp. HJP-4 TaxID=2775394 RepID=UPI0035CCF454
MAKRIPDEIIAEIRHSLDITDVIGEHVQLKKKGKHYMGLCPFHGEKTPSFSVSPERQLYHCFGCGAGGNSITFIMEMEGIPFVEAVNKLAEKAKIQLPEEVKTGPSGSVSTGTIHKAKLEGLELAARFYHHLLMNTEQGRAAYHYLLERGVTPEMMETFRIGYSPEQAGLLKGLLEKRDFNLHEMEEAGLLYRVDSDWELRDRFRSRVMFPIHDLQGKVIGFGGRSLGEAEPKYLNSPESSIFKKNEILYGMSLARPAIRKNNEAVLFEGYADVISAAGAGVSNSIANMGTSLTERQAQIIRRNCERVIVCYDGDNAGREAAWKTAVLLEEEGLHVLVAMVPDQTDPDDYIREYGGERFKQSILDKSLPVLSFKINTLKKNKNLQDEGERLQYIEEVLGEISKVSKATERDFYLRQIAEEFSLSLDALKQEQYRIYRKTKKSFTKNNSRSAEISGRGGQQVLIKRNKLLPAFQNAERMLLLHMMNDKEAAEEIEERLGGDFNIDQHIAIAAHLYSYYANGNSSDPGTFINYLQEPELIKTASEIAMLDTDNQLTENELSDYIKLVKNYPKWEEIEQKEQKMKEAERNQDIEQALQLANELILMKKELKNGQRA